MAHIEKGKSNDEGDASVAASEADNSTSDLLDVQIVLMNGFLIPLLHFIYVLIEIGLSPMILQGGGFVRLGDDSPRDIVGIGSVQIKMHDGIVRTLTDVRHIPSISKNLISLSTLDGKGYKYFG
jgi:hypothetical protein